MAHPSPWLGGHPEGLLEEKGVKVDSTWGTRWCRSTVSLGLEGDAFIQQTLPRANLGHGHAGRHPEPGARGAMG